MLAALHGEDALMQHNPPGCWTAGLTTAYGYPQAVGGAPASRSGSFHRSTLLQP